MWFFLAITGYFLLAVVLVLDKFILSKSVAKPVVYTFYSTVFLLAAFGVAPFGVDLLQGADYWWAIASGFTFGFGMWTMFCAVKEGEASHIDPFIGAVTTIATYALSIFLLNENLSSAQAAGVMVVSFGTLLLAFEKSKTHHGFHAGFLWAIASGIFFAISSIAAKYLYDHHTFLTGLVWSRGTAGIFGLCLLFLPSVRHAIAHTPHKKAKTYAKRHARSIVVANKVLSVIGIIMLHYSISIGSVTIINALAGAQYVFMFIMIYGLTKCLPKVFREYFTKHELAVETIAIVLVTLGSLFFVL
ncbi:MAG TPA: DMT family transporter [Candidatus Kapabacteria bacterium]|nr:DMT family transporter [Candidatus Kapabacteria bacterium]